MCVTYRIHVALWLQQTADGRDALNARRMHGWWMQQGVRVSEASEGDVKARRCSGGDVNERIRCGTAVLGGTKGVMGLIAVAAGPLWGSGDNKVGT